MERSIENQIAALRKEYSSSSLSENDILPDPVLQFEKWFREAIDAKVTHPDAMTLATATPQGIPDARTVLLKGIKAGAFIFYTNYQSAKGQQLSANAAATLLFFWGDLERQVRIKGSVVKLSDADSDAYFSTRPLGAQLAASISPQSQVVPNRDWLEQQVESKRHELSGKAVARPMHWGGYLLTPHEFEFWQGREDRLHDRLRYKKSNGSWIIERLAP